MALGPDHGEEPKARESWKPMGNLERNCYMRHVHDSDWFDMIWNDGFWPASCFWHLFHHFKHALACFGNSSCLSTMKTETENRFLFLQPFVFCLRLPWKRDMGWFGVWEGRAFGSWHAPPLRCGLLWSCFSTSISGGRVGRCFPLQSLLVLRRWCFVYKT